MTPPWSFLSHLSSGSWGWTSLDGGGLLHLVGDLFGQQMTLSSPLFDGVYIRHGRGLGARVMCIHFDGGEVVLTSPSMQISFSSLLCRVYTIALIPFHVVCSLSLTHAILCTLEATGHMPTHAD